MKQEITQGYRDSLKSLDTEEHIDLYFYRPLGFAWAKLAAKLGVTPNVITVASIFLGIGAGVGGFPARAQYTDQQGRAQQHGQDALG